MYRAYYYVVHDTLENIHYDAITGFDPVSFLRTRAKQGQINLFIKASWICYGNTAYKKVCPIPPPLAPKFKQGQVVTVNIAGHATEKWQGIVELSLWRRDLASNVYGIRFPENYNQYGNYLEDDLQIIN